MVPKYALAQLTALEANPVELIRLAARCGYDHVGARLLPVAPGGVAYPLMDNPKMLRETQAATADTGVTFFDMELIRLNADFDPQNYLAFFEVGALLGAKAVLVAGDDPERQRLIDHYGQLCDAMAPFGLTADLEFMPWTAVPDLQAALEVVSQADRPNAGILVDALHFDRSGSRLEQLRDIPRQWLHYAQICDGPAHKPGSDEGLIHAARCDRWLPGEGGIDLAAIWQALPADLPVSVEIPNVAGVAQMGVDAWALTAIRKAKQLLGH